MISGCKSLGMARDPGGKCRELLKSINATHWFVLDSDDPTGERGVFQEAACGVSQWNLQVEMNGTCRYLGRIDGCAGAPMTLHVNLYGQGVCKCHCPLNSTLCETVEDAHQIPMDQCYKERKDEDFDEYEVYYDHIYYLYYNCAPGYRCIQYMLTTELPVLVSDKTICREGQVMSKNGRCFDEDQPLELTSSRKQSQNEQAYADYLRKVVGQDFYHYS